MSKIVDICKINFTFGKSNLTKYEIPFFISLLVPLPGLGAGNLHVPLSILGKSHGMINIMDPPSATRAIYRRTLFFICTALLMTAGLFLVAFAKEKIEDEQIWHIRLDSLRWAIYVNYLVLIISLVFIDDVPHMLELNLWVPLLFFDHPFQVGNLPVEPFIKPGG